MSDTHISVRDLNVYYGKHQALRNINVEIPRNEITVILGPSGCGKTTLLKSLNRLLDITAGVKVTGQVLLDGTNIYDPAVDVTEVRKRAGLLSQRPYPLPMSIYDNVAFGPRVHGLTRGRDLDAAVQHHLEMAGCGTK